MDVDVHARTTRAALWMALLLAACHAAACTCSGERDALASVKQDIRDSLERTLGLDIQSITCADGVPAAARDCLVSVRDGDSLVVEILAAGDAGVVRWRLRGRRHIEHQLALGMVERVRNRPERVVCPEFGGVDALARGFECRVVFAGGVDTVVAITASERPDRFEWVARSILMPGVIEARIADDLLAAGKRAEVSCGSELRPIIPGGAFECVIEHDGGVDVADVNIIDDGGHVQYRLRGEE